MEFKDNEIKPVEKKGRAKWIVLVVALLVVTNTIAFFAGNVAAVSMPGIGLRDMEVKKSLEGIKDVSKFKKLFDIRDKLYLTYDGEINEDLLVEGAIKGMVNSLGDPYTVFMNKKEFADLLEKNEGSYVGLGIQVGVKDDKIVVISAFDGSPAEKAGILSGDVILKVNDTEVSGKDMDKAVAMMKGKEKVNVKITLFRESKGTFDLNVKRDVINMVTVKGEMLDSSIGYINIAMFDEKTSDEFNKVLKSLKDKGMKGLILDLRGNPGGLLTECVNVVSNFVEKGKVIVSTIDKYKNEEKNVSKGGIALGLPLVVLTDEGTASASEIVSGAIRDYKIGTLVGTKTFGKGVVQRIFDAGDGEGLKVTVSKYYTPNGENIHKIGIAPDIEVPYTPEMIEKNRKAYEESKGKLNLRSVDPQFNKAVEVIKEKVK